MALELPDEDDKDGPTGCSISLIKPHRELARLQKALPQFNVLLPNESDIGIYFGSDGIVDGTSVGYRTAHDPRVQSLSVKH